MSLDSSRIQYQTIFDKTQALLSRDELEWSCEIIDISLQGCLLRFKNTWEQQNIEAIYTLTLQPPESVAIIMNLSIRHAIANEVGFKCEHLDKNNSALLCQLAGSDSDTHKLLARDLIELTHIV